jgi:hypothetical protein
MSLNWNLGKIPNNETVCWNADEMNPITKGLIFQTMAVDLGEITEKNIPEWMFRMAVASKVAGQPMTKCVDDGNGGTKLEGFDFTEEDIRQHIGLSTNVCNKSRASFMKKVMQMLERDVTRSLQWKKERALQTKEAA